MMPALQRLAVLAAFSALTALTALIVFVAAPAAAHGPGRPDDGRLDDGRPPDGHDGPHGRPDERASWTCPANVVAAFDAMDDALRHMADDVDGLKRKQERAHLRAEVATALERSQDARRVACRASRDDRPDVIVVQQPPPVVVVLDEPQHRELVTVVRREAFDDGRLGVLQLGVRDVCVTASQARDLVQQLTFSQPRIDAIRVLAPRIVDRDRSHLLLESLTFDSDRKTARQILTSTSPAAHCVVHRT